jgi:type I restriction enzyme, S subunit
MKTRVRLGEMATFRNGLNYSKESFGTGCKVIGVTSFKKRLVPDYEALEEINPDGVVSKNDFLKSGDVVFVRSNGNKALVGRSLFIEKDESIAISGFCIRARLHDSRLLPKYFAYFTKTDFFKRSIGHTASTSINNLNQGVLADVEVPLPSVAEQKSIVKVLDAIQEKITLNNKINAKLEKMAKLIYDYWFVQFDFPDENGKPYKSSGGKLTWCDQLKREIPDGWGSTSLWSIAKYFNGLAMQKHRPKGSEYLPVIKIREMSEGFNKGTERAKSDLPTSAIVENGDILFSWSATLEVMIWAGGRGALNQHIFKVTPLGHPKTWVYFQLRNYLTHFKMMADGRKTTMGHITQDHLKQSRTISAPTELIGKFDQLAIPMLQQQVSLREQNRELANLRDWLLPMLMNGQVTVGDYISHASHNRAMQKQSVQGVATR